MSERLPENLALLYEAFGRDVIDSLGSGDTFTIDGIDFVCRYMAGSTPDRFFIVKTPPLIDRYRELCNEFTGRTIFELGIAEGGSTVLMALLARPRKLVAVDLEPDRLAALDGLAERRGLVDVIRPHYGVDQADRRRLHAILDEELGDEPLDLVVDDCSHQLEPTRASFEALFPRLRPGGLYVIEDWNNDHLFRDAMVRTLRDPMAPGHDDQVRQLREAMASSAGQRDQPRVPLSRLGLELMLAQASADPGIESVTVDRFWLSVRRGAGDLDPATFHLGDMYADHFALLR